MLSWIINRWDQGTKINKLLLLVSLVTTANRWFSAEASLREVWIIHRVCTYSITRYFQTTISKITKIPCTNCVSGCHKSWTFIFLFLKIIQAWRISFNSNQHLMGENIGSCRHWQTILKRVGARSVVPGQDTCLACLGPWVQAPAWEEMEVSLLGLSWVIEYSGV